MTADTDSDTDMLTLTVKSHSQDIETVTGMAVY